MATRIYLVKDSAGRSMLVSAVSKQQAIGHFARKEYSAIVAKAKDIVDFMTTHSAAAVEDATKAEEVEA